MHKSLVKVLRLPRRKLEPGLVHVIFAQICCLSGLPCRKKNTPALNSYFSNRKTSRGRGNFRQPAFLGFSSICYSILIDTCIRRQCTHPEHVQKYMDIPLQEWWTHFACVLYYLDGLKRKDTCFHCGPMPVHRKVTAMLYLNSTCLETNLALDFTASCFDRRTKSSSR